MKPKLEFNLIYIKFNFILTPELVIPFEMSRMKNYNNTFLGRRVPIIVFFIVSCFQVFLRCACMYRWFKISNFLSYFKRLQNIDDITVRMYYVQVEVSVIITLIITHRTLTNWTCCPSTAISYYSLLYV